MMKMWRCLPSNITVKNRLSIITCTPHDVESLIELINPNIATGPDGISNKMFKAVAKDADVHQSILFIRYFRESKFAEIFKHSNVITLPQKGDNSNPSFFYMFHF